MRSTPMHHRISSTTSRRESGHGLPRYAATLLLFATASLSLVLLAPEALAQSAGDRVLGKWSDGMWYPATVGSVSGSKVSLKFDDGDKATVDADDVRAIHWKVGTKVQCNWKGKGSYYKGVISSKNGESVHIKYDDGDEEDTTIGRCRSTTATKKLSSGGKGKDLTEAEYRASSHCKKAVKACKAGYCSGDGPFGEVGTREQVYSCYEECLEDTDPRCTPVDCRYEAENCYEDSNCAGNGEDACVDACLKKRGFTECPGNW